MKKRVLLALMTLILLPVLGGCAWWQTTAKPVVSTVDDLARSMCAIYYGEQMGVDVDAALETYCEYREQWAPWIDPALASMQVGAAAKLEASLPATEPTPLEVPTSPPPAVAPVQPAVAPAVPKAPDPGGGTETPSTPPSASGDAG